MRPEPKYAPTRRPPFGDDIPGIGIRTVHTIARVVLIEDDPRSVPGARIHIAGVVFAIDEADKNDLADELLSIARPNAPSDAATATACARTRRGLARYT
jgi:hypothetical protein